ncbi:major facilitator superfamily MFS_1 [Komagataeibacter xylinus E25]|nr:major facilitator superfamily MFS_1 [Komagataeibacter xylinus E25]
MDKRLFVLALGMFALGTDSFVVAGVLPQIAYTFAVPIGVAGQMTTIYAITYALLAPTIAALAATVRRKFLLLSSLALFVLANVGTALAPTYALAMLTRVLAGISAAMFAPTATGAAAMLVAPEKRGFALSVVIAGLSGSTALGTPIGAVIGHLGDWRWTMAFVAGLALIAGIGVWTMLPEIPAPPKIGLKQRLIPLADPRITFTLLTTLLTMSGIFTVYTYFTVVFDRVIGGNAVALGLFLVLWGAAGTLSNLLVGRLIDVLGNRRMISVMLSVLVIDTLLLPFASANVWTAVVAIVIWGGCGWGYLVPQQHRLVSVASQIAPVVLGLNTSCSYIGVSVGGLLGALAIQTVSAHNLGYIGALPIIGALVSAELASWKIRSSGAVKPESALASA